MNFIDLKSGTTVENMVIHSYKTEQKSQKYVYLIAGVHGDEVEGVYVLGQLFEWLKTTTEVELPLVVIPILNIDGYRTASRLNSHAVDLNRNLPTVDWTEQYTVAKHNPGPQPLSEPENKYLVKLFEKYPPYIALSFHSWKPMLNYNGNCKNVAEFLNKYNHYPLASDVGYPTPGSLGTYLPEKYHVPVLTFECPVLGQERTLKTVWEENQEGLIKLMVSDLLNPKSNHCS